MTDRTPNAKICQTYAFHGERCFFVSLIERESSAARAYGARYHEWIAWDMPNGAAEERGEMLYQGTGWTSYLDSVRQLATTGKYVEDDDA